MDFDKARSFGVRAMQWGAVIAIVTGKIPIYSAEWWVVIFGAGIGVTSDIARLILAVRK